MTMLLCIDLHEYLAKDGLVLYEIRVRGREFWLCIGPRGDPAKAEWVIWNAFLQQHGRALCDLLNRRLKALPPAGTMLTRKTRRTLVDLGIPVWLMPQLRHASDPVAELKHLIRRDLTLCAVTANGPVWHWSKAVGGAAESQVEALYTVMRQYSSDYGPEGMVRAGNAAVWHRESLRRIGRDYVARELAARGAIQDSRQVEVVYGREGEVDPYLVDAFKGSKNLYVFPLPMAGGNCVLLVGVADLRLSPTGIRKRGYRAPCINVLSQAMNRYIAESEKTLGAIGLLTGTCTPEQFKAWLDEPVPVAERVRLLSACWGLIVKGNPAVRKAAIECLLRVAKSGEANDPDLARLLMSCASDDKTAPLLAPALNGFAAAMDRDSVPELCSWLHWFQPACAVWIEAACRRCVMDGTSAVWLSILDTWIAAFDRTSDAVPGPGGGPRLAVVRINADPGSRSLLAVEGVPGNTTHVRMWEGDGGQWAYANSQKFPGASGVVLCDAAANSPMALLTRDASGGTPRAWVWSKRTWKLAQNLAGTLADPTTVRWENVRGAWQGLRQNGQSSSPVRRFCQERLLELLKNRPNVVADGFAAMARFLMPTAAPVLDMLFQCEPSLSRDTKFQEAFWERARGAPEPLAAWIKKRSGAAGLARQPPHQISALLTLVKA